MRRLPTYDLVGWRCVHEDRDRLAFRPGPRVLAIRFGVMVVCGIIVAGVYFWAVKPSSHGRFGAPRAPAEAERTAARGRQDAVMNQAFQVAFAAAVAVMAIVGAVGVLAPLSLLWNRTAIGRDVRGNLVVSTWGLMPRNRSWPIADLGRIAVSVWEEVHRDPRSRIMKHLGWRWHVRLESKTDGRSGPPQPGDGMPERVVDFCPDRQKERPREGGRPPEAVSRVVRWLMGSTGLPVVGPSFVEHRMRGARPHAGTGSHTFVSAAPPQVTRQVYHSFDEMPPEIRARAVEMMAQAREQGIPPGEPIGMTSQRITICDQDGNLRTYTSPDEMPPDVRETYERMRRDRS